jgi:voltage-gated potassium channel
MNERIRDNVEKVLIALSFIWLVLLIIDLTLGLTPLFQNIVMAIWIIFIGDLVISFLHAEKKLVYLKRNWLTVISVILPAFRILRVFRAFRFARVIATSGRGFNLVRIFSTVNRTMRALAATFGKGAFGYVFLLTVIVVLSGTAGIYSFEKGQAPSGQPGINSIGSALWWTSMIMTTLGSDYWPQTPEGRILCFFLSLYAFALFGYVTAILATFFLGNVDKEAKDKEKEDIHNSIARLIKDTSEIKEALKKRDIQNFKELKKET